MAESGGLLNRCTSKIVPRVRIPLSPPFLKIKPVVRHDSMIIPRICCYAWLLLAAGQVVAATTDEPLFSAELVFPLHHQHNHAPSIVECQNGDLLVSWYRGSGERQADDVAVFGARRRLGDWQWSKPFVMADNPGFPDGNTVMWIDDRDRLWLVWPIVLANTWESCVTKIGRAHV